MKISDQVENILRGSLRARNSDKELFIQFMQANGMSLSEYQINIFRKMPSLETVRRTRQKIQEGGKYPANKKIDQERQWKSLRMQQNTPTAKPHTIERIVEQGKLW